MRRPTTIAMIVLSIISICLFSSSLAFSPSCTHVHSIRIHNQKSYYRSRYAAITNDDADAVVNGVVSTMQLKNDEDSSTYDFTKEEIADISKLSSDLNKLKNLRPAEPSSDFSAPTALISAGSSYTRLWTYATWSQHADPPHIRYLRHVLRWPLSTSARKILPAVCISASYSLIMSFILTLPIGNVYMDEYVRIKFQLGSMTKGASAAMAALSAPLALLLTLRANASLGRLTESRQLFGRLILRGRNLASVLATYVAPTDPSAALLATRYLSIYGWSIKALVRNESLESQKEVYATMLREKEADWLISQNIKPTLAIILRLRQLLAKVSMKSENPNYFVPHSSIEQAIDDLDAVSGGCERLLSSPIPPTYSRHLSRIMVMYLALLPIALVGSGVPTFGSAIASALVSYVIIGVDEIGMELENPFPLLPLQQLCSALQNVVGEQILLLRG